jgi:hypothetical protein
VRRGTRLAAVVAGAGVDSAARAGYAPAAHRSAGRALCAAVGLDADRKARLTVGRGPFPAAHATIAVAVGRAGSGRAVGTERWAYLAGLVGGTGEPVARRHDAAMAIGARAADLTGLVALARVAIGAKRGGASMGIGASARGCAHVAGGAGETGRAGHGLAPSRRSAALVDRTRGRRARGRAVGPDEAAATGDAGRHRLAHLGCPTVGVHRAFVGRGRLHVAGYWAAAGSRRRALPAIEPGRTVALLSA